MTFKVEQRTVCVHWERLSVRGIPERLSENLPVLVQVRHGAGRHHHVDWPIAGHLVGGAAVVTSGIFGFWQHEVFLQAFWSRLHPAMRGFGRTRRAWNGFAGRIVETCEPSLPFIDKVPANGPQYCAGIERSPAGLRVNAV